MGRKKKEVTEQIVTPSQPKMSETPEATETLALKEVEKSPVVETPKKAALRYKSVTIGRDTSGKRWATILETIEDGKVVNREVLCTNTSKSTAIDRCKIAVVRNLLKEEHRVL